ncbi:hypothetical protein HMN09_00324100 [Mycena chlorophos]|uniref:Uncharacterized protein n=1 Tax=Mycena chlorophos TaxID=658473 RepID=A0A8H6WMV4_MYCCL|nr:hypothetical protein HMN09_00324100 [Mycena chlorophos]
MLRSLLPLVLFRLCGVALGLSPDLGSVGMRRAAQSAPLHVLTRRAGGGISQTILIAIIVGSVGGVALLLTIILLIRLGMRRGSEEHDEASPRQADFSNSSSYAYGQASINSPNTPAQFRSPVDDRYVSAASTPQSMGGGYYGVPMPPDPDPESPFNGYSPPGRNKSVRRITADQSLWFPEKVPDEGSDESPRSTQNFSLPRQTKTSFSSILPASRTLERKASLQQLLEASGLGADPDAPPLPQNDLVRTRSTPSPALGPTPITPEMSAALANRAARLRAASPPTLSRKRSEPELPLAQSAGGSPPKHLARDAATHHVPPPLHLPEQELHAQVVERTNTVKVIPRPRESSLSPEQRSTRAPIVPVRRHQVSASEDTAGALARPSSRFSVSPVGRSFPGISMNILGGRDDERQQQQQQLAANGVGSGARKSRHTRKFGSDVLP